jgi:hypothetical protein
METKTPANDEAGTTETSNARNRVLKARIVRIASLLAFRSQIPYAVSVTGLQPARLYERGAHEFVAGRCSIR